MSCLHAEVETLSINSGTPTAIRLSCGLESPTAINLWLVTRCSLICRLSYGGSLIRPEATGYGLIYFLEEMVKENNDTLKVCVILSPMPCPSRRIISALITHPMT